MKTFIMIMISIVEFGLAERVIRQYSKDGDYPTFVANAPLEKYLYVRAHMMIGFLTMQAATIMSMIK